LPARRERPYRAREPFAHRYDQAVSITAGSVAAAALGIATIAVLWRLSRDRRRGRGEHAAETPRPALVLTAAGAVVAALGAALVLADPWDTADAVTIGTVLGGPAIALVGDLVAERATSGRIVASRIIALACLAVLALIAFALPALVLAALAFAALLLLALAAAGWFRLPAMDVDDQR
jgi:low temperature requirement protein LtrA